MSTVVVATSPAEVRAVGERSRPIMHGWLAPPPRVQVEALVEATARGGLPRAASDALVRWCDAELIPYAVAEEQAMYTAAREDPRARLLVDAMAAEHCNLVALVEADSAATSQCALRQAPWLCGHCSNRTLSRRTSRHCRCWLGPVRPLWRSSPAEPALLGSPGPG